MRIEEILRKLRTNEHTLFERIELLNIENGSKKRAQLFIKPKVDGLVYTNKKNGLNIVGFVDNETELLVVDKTVRTGRQITTPHQRYHELAVEYAMEKFNDAMKMLEANSKELDLYKPISQIRAQINEWFDINVFDFYKDLHKKLKELPTRQVPLYNEYIRYKNDEGDVNKLSSVILPYNNPKGLLDKDVKHIDKFLDVFFEQESKEIFSWYMGAVMCNEPLQNDNVSKLLFVHGKSGSGKSSLVLGLGQEMLSSELIHIASEFDSYFALNNRFATSDLTSRRLSIYNESDWGYKERNDLPHPHDFTGINAKAIQTLITDGYLDSEKKYEGKETTLKTGLHIILTNHIPIINDDNDALRRRFMPCMLKPTSMFEKAQELGIEGSGFREYIGANALDFAIYFVGAYNKFKNKFKHYIYSHTDYTSDFEDEKKSLYEQAEDKRSKLIDAGRQGFDELLDELMMQDYNIDALLVDLELDNDNIKHESGTLYINSSKVYFSSISKKGDFIRNLFMDLYGSPVKKYGKNCFVIDIGDLKTIRDRLFKYADDKNVSIDDVCEEFVINYQLDEDNLYKIFDKKLVDNALKSRKKIFKNSNNTFDDDLFNIKF